MSRTTPQILDLAFDDVNIDEMAAHGVSACQALQVLDNGARIGRNRKDRTATHLLIGRDNGGACIAIPVEPTADPTVWRPLTAWYCKSHEWNLLPQR